MSEENAKPHPGIRTFAGDLEAARGKNKPVTPDGSSADQNQEDTKIPTPPPGYAQAPQQTTHVEPKIVVPKKSSPTEKQSDTQHSERPQTKIPAFHELKQKVDKQVAKNTKVPAKKPEKKIVPKITVNKNSKKPSRANIGYDSEVITDTKGGNFHLFKEIGASLKSWFKALSFSRKKKAPVYTVPDTQRRKGIIQRATSKSGSIFTADSAELRAKIKQRQKLVENAKQEQPGESDLSWSPYTDPGFSLLESPEEDTVVDGPHNVAVEFKKQAQTAPVPEAPKSVTPPVPPAPVEEPVHETPPAPPKTEPIPRPPQPEPEPESLTEDKAIEEPGEITLQTLSTNTLAISVLAGLTVVIAIFFIGKTVFQYFVSTDAPVPTDTTLYLDSATANQVTVAKMNSISDIPLQADTASEGDYIDTQLFLPSGQIVPPAMLITALEFTVLPSFTQSLTDLRFAHVGNSAPVIVFTFTDTDTVLGGLLAWEKTLAADLSALYPISQLNNLTFTDERIENIDVRVLTTSAGTVLAVYGIVSENTAIVTDSRGTFTHIVTTSFAE